jgi:ribosomal protein S25
MEVLSHEALHRSDSHNRRVVTLADLAERSAISLATAYSVEQILSLAGVVDEKVLSAAALWAGSYPLTP